MTTKAERLLTSGLAEAQADLEFIRSHTIDDDAMRLLLDESINVARLYLRAARDAIPAWGRDD